MHLGGIVNDFLAQCICELHTGTPPRFTVEQRAAVNCAAQHLFKAHRLCAQLQFVTAVIFGLAAFVFDGVRQPQPFVPGKRNALRTAPEFNHIALTAQPERKGIYAQTAGNDSVAAALAETFVMRTLVHQFALDSAKIFRPLLLNVYQRPLPPAEAEVLQAGDHQAVVRLVHHESLSQVTPSGIFSATVTV